MNLVGDSKSVDEINADMQKLISISQQSHVISINAHDPSSKITIKNLSDTDKEYTITEYTIKELISAVQGKNYPQLIATLKAKFGYSDEDLMRLVSKIMEGK